MGTKVPHLRQYLSAKVLIGYVVELKVKGKQIRKRFYLKEFNSDAECFSAAQEYLNSVTPNYENITTVAKLDGDRILLKDKSDRAMEHLKQVSAKLAEHKTMLMQAEIDTCKVQIAELQKRLAALSTDNTAFEDAEYIQLVQQQDEAEKEWEAAFTELTSVQVERTRVKRYIRSKPSKLNPTQ